MASTLRTRTAIREVAVMDTFFVPLRTHGLKENHRPFFFLGRSQDGGAIPYAHNYMENSPVLARSVVELRDREKARTGVHGKKTTTECASCCLELTYC